MSATRLKVQKKASSSDDERLEVFVDAFRSLLLVLPGSVADEIAPLLFEAEAKATIALAKRAREGKDQKL